MGPALGAGPLGQSADRIPEGGRFEGTGQKRQLGADVPAGGRGAFGGHDAASSPRPRMRS